MRSAAFHRANFGLSGAERYHAYPDLAVMMEKARYHVMTPKEIYEQKISWIQGMTGRLNDPMPSRELVVKALETMGIVDPEPNAAPQVPGVREAQGNEPISSSPADAAPEWIPWHGGPAPVGKDVMVEVEFRDGSVYYDRDWIWQHSQQEDDIVAYRFVGATKHTSHKRATKA